MLYIAGAYNPPILDYIENGNIINYNQIHSEGGAKGLQIRPPEVTGATVNK